MKISKKMIITIIIIMIFIISVISFIIIDQYVFYGKNNRKLAVGSSPKFSPDGTKIIYSRYDESGYNYGLYIMNSDGSDQSKIIEVELERTNFCIDVTNTWVLYHKNDYHEYDSGIWIVKVDGTDNHKIKNGYHATFSPDGKRILYGTYEQNDYDNWRNRNNTLRIMDLNGSNDMLIMRTYYPNDILYPMFFSDGQRILFCLDNLASPVERRGYYDKNYNENDTFRAGTWIINIDGTSPEKLANDGGAGVSPWTKAIVSENQKKIIRYGSTHVHHMTLWAMNTDGSNEIQLKGSQNYIGGADISRDGKWAFYSLSYENSFQSENDIIMKRTNGEKEHKLIQGYNPESSPTKNLIVYTINGEIWSVEY
jgi:Tol biopolymer transport system component